jgi:hypothetical protein
MNHHNGHVRCPQAGRSRTSAQRCSRSESTASRAASAAVCQLRTGPSTGPWGPGCKTQNNTTNHTSRSRRKHTSRDAPTAHTVGRAYQMPLSLPTAALLMSCAQRCTGVTNMHLVVVVTRHIHRQYTSTHRVVRVRHPESRREVIGGDDAVVDRPRLQSQVNSDDQQPRQALTTIPHTQASARLTLMARLWSSTFSSSAASSKK